MATQSKISKHHRLPLTTTHWQNRSLSSLSATSEAVTFYSSHAHLSSSNMELRQLTSSPKPQQQHSQPQREPQPQLQRELQLHCYQQPHPSPLPPLELGSFRMDRQDSGYAASASPLSPTSDSRRKSTSSAFGPGRRNTSSSRGKRKSTSGSISTSISLSTSSTTRPPRKRKHRSSVRISNPGARPALSSRHTTPYSASASLSPSSSQTQPPSSQFFQFPSLPPPSPPPAPQPPATVQYWTSDSTRRLEYAAIDAASKGVKGFFVRMVPDCILPQEKRRARFCDGEEGSEAGSVRRYRLVLPEEGEAAGEKAGTGGGEGRIMGVWRRWTGVKLGRREGD
ncbi:hypothetical protein B2J93_3467 [Marssonina coronariae]|uniref:Uncharacterized protein n=1 Tax=Diplocarpon coronariae TaxID=2795749 RepID=A0A218Z4E1_9HELO|nr:hypothetical protein B2J93_3467 [Marssonina coronariae]